MGYDDFEILGMSALDPTPDEEAWEAYLDFAHPILGGDDSLGLAAQDVRQLEEQVGAEVPWEIGLFLVLGVPAADGWWRWGDGAAVHWVEWQTALLANVSAMVAAGAWAGDWGERPAEDAALESAVAAGVAAAPVLLPLFEDCAVPLAVADGLPTNIANPILRVGADGVEQVGVDLADWLHQRFDVPLPMWPPSPTRTFPTWPSLHPQ